MCCFFSVGLRLADARTRTTGVYPTVPERPRSLSLPLASHVHRIHPSCWRNVQPSDGLHPRENCTVALWYPAQPGAPRVPDSHQDRA